MKTMFLDFDGVLHRSTAILEKDIPTLALHGAHQLRAGGLFQWCDRLEQALAPDQHIGIVVHSSWRNQQWLSSDLVREALGPLGHRFQGFVERHSPREKAILNFIDRMHIDDFLILDDAHHEFDLLKARLVVTNPLLGVSEDGVLERVSCWSAAGHRHARPEITPA